MGAVIRLITAEFMKAVRQKLPWMGLAFSALIALLSKQTVERMATPGEISSRVYLAFNLNLASTAIIPIFSTVFAATLLASETSRGSLRMILPHPIRRSQFLHAKLITGLIYLVLMFLANLLVAFPIAASYPLTTKFDEGLDLPGLGGQLFIFAIAFGLTLIPHAATVCFALLVSVLSRSVATAIGVAVGIIFCLLPVQVFVRFGNLQLGDYIFSSYYDKAIGIGNSNAGGMSESWNQENIHLLLSTSILSSAVFLGIAYWVFIRRDLNG